MSFKPVQRTQGGLWLIHPSGGYQDQLVRFYEMDLKTSYSASPTKRLCYQYNYVEELQDTLTFPDGKCLGVDLTKHGLYCWIDASTTNMSATDLIGPLQLACDCQSGNGATMALVLKFYDQCDKLISSGTVAYVNATASGNPDLPEVQGVMQYVGVGSSADRPTYLKSIGLFLGHSQYHGGTIDIDGKLLLQGIW